jgi:hypothetical protein
VIILGISLLIIGFAAKIAATWAIGTIVVVTGAILALAGMAWPGTRPAGAGTARPPAMAGRTTGNRQAAPGSTGTDRRRTWRRAWSYGSFATS